MEPKNITEVVGIAKEIIEIKDELLVAYRVGSHAKADKALSKLERIQRKYPKTYKELTGKE